MKVHVEISRNKFRKEFPHIVAEFPDLTKEERLTIYVERTFIPTIFRVIEDIEPTEFSFTVIQNPPEAFVLDFTNDAHGQFYIDYVGGWKVE